MTAACPRFDAPHNAAAAHVFTPHAPPPARATSTLTRNNCEENASRLQLLAQQAAASVYTRTRGDDCRHVDGADFNGRDNLLRCEAGVTSLLRETGLWLMNCEHDCDTCFQELSEVREGREHVRCSESSSTDAAAAAAAAAAAVVACAFAASLRVQLVRGSAQAGDKGAGGDEAGENSSLLLVMVLLPTEKSRELCVDVQLQRRCRQRALQDGGADKHAGEAGLEISRRRRRRYLPAQHGLRVDCFDGRACGEYGSASAGAYAAGVAQHVKRRERRRQAQKVSRV